MPPVDAAVDDPDDDAVTLARWSPGMDSRCMDLGQAIVQFLIHASRAFDLHHMLDGSEIIETIKWNEPGGNLVALRRMLDEAVLLKSNGGQGLQAAGEFH